MLIYIAHRRKKCL